MRQIATAIALIAAPVVMAGAGAVPASAQDSVAREIEDLGGGLHRWTSGNYHSMFLVHDEGIMVADPLNEEAATWLRAQLKERYPGLPITHVIYSHSHPDHAYGGRALDDGATQFIAHELAAETWELNRALVRRPDITFADSFTLALPGAGTIELAYWGQNNGKGSVSMYFAEHDTLHVVDWIVLGRLPYRTLGGYDIGGMIASTRAVLADVPFTTFVGGHADMGSREDVEEYLSYIEALHSGVLSGIIAGRSLEEIQQTLDLSAYSHLKQFDAWKDENIEGVYNQLVDDYYVTMRPEVPEPGAT
ncbi:MBL fold metallo-hydrolase [Croceicoccus gelatinilyticus]|uniref:MBL fold metallo-hydrolase n=1 Tax=Croceicoccus gelatinilyticus TaxID=2835536 RepID=UPI001BD06B6C|nr:MBL fold metallo-hydrolase [Croceicoccus gelatinilyticus]MBS7671459.1 MBL fold metallo-hydrolase [Croceicoccus gelatinilyticus]